MELLHKSGELGMRPSPNRPFQINCTMFDDILCSESACIAYITRVQVELPVAPYNTMSYIRHGEDVRGAIQDFEPNSN